MESDAKEPTGVTRGQNAVHLLPLDWGAAEPVLASLIDRLDPERAETQLLIVTADAESAAAAAVAAVKAAGDRPLRVVAATASPRAARLLKSSPAHVVAGAPAELVTLLQGSALKPQGVRAVIFAWLDPILGSADAAPMEELFGELPKEGARVVVASEITPALEALIERYARRARRAPEAPVDATAPVLHAEYVTTATSARAATLRRLLDALDLPRAVLHARSDALRAEALATARALGYPGDAVRLSGEAVVSSDPLVLLELPVSHGELRALVGASARKLYAVITPSQAGSLRTLLGGGTATPVALVEAAERARGRDAALRGSLREVLVSGDVRREVLALEPLLAEFDGIEIAAAALRLLEQQRPARPSASVAAASQPMQRLFLNLGDKDGIRAQEIVTAVTTEAGIPGSQVGKVEVRDTHSIVEVAASVAELVAGKLTGSTVRGRRVQARVDAPREERAGARGGERPARSGPPRSGAPRGDRPARPFDRGDRPARPFDRGDRPAARSFEKGGDRPARSGPPGGDRPDRPARPFNGPRKFDGGARPARPRPRRDDA